MTMGRPTELDESSSFTCFFSERQRAYIRIVQAQMAREVGKSISQAAALRRIVDDHEARTVEPSELPTC